MRRSPGGRNHVLYVRLTEEEASQIRIRAGTHGLSAQRFVVEAALSGSAELAASRRHAGVEVRAGPVILKGIANNLNQLTKWANANHALPGHLDRLFVDLSRAVLAVEQTARDLGSPFDQGDRRDHRGNRESPS